MVIVYGSMLCPDCVACKEDFDQKGIAYDYRDFSENLKHLKEFLAIRDTSSLFDPIRAEGKIGIPCIVKENGEVTLSWEELIK